MTPRPANPPPNPANHTPTTPRRRPAVSRTKGKARRASTTPYPAEVRDAAVEQLAAEGMAATHAATKIPKGTLGRWAKAAGVDLGEQARARTAVAASTVRARSAEVRASTVELLEQHIAQAGDYLSTIAGVNALAAQLIRDVDPDRIRVEQGIAGPYAVVEDETAAEVAKVALALAGLPYAPRDAEGLVTRAIHDLQLLRGEATERGELVVEFNVPRPHPSTATVVEVPALEEN